MRNLFVCSVGIILLSVLPIKASAADSLQTTLSDKAKTLEEKNFLSLSIENDSLGDGTDNFYTSGVRLTWFNVNTPVPMFADDLADAIPTFDLNESTSTFFTFGQNIYTPEDISVSANQPDDRPWAAWLYGSVGMTTVTGNHLDELEITLGLVGPEALGEQTQKFTHTHISDSPIPQGWDNQLSFEPGAILSWQRRWPYAKKIDFGDTTFRVEPNINVSLGNVYTYAGTGVSFIWGGNKALQDTPPRVRPAMPGTGFFETPDSGFNWHLFTALDARVVGRNIFLDGNTFRDSPGVDKKYLVDDASAGVALTFDRYRLAYSINARSDEFKGQDKTSVFGSLTLSTRF